MDSLSTGINVIKKNCIMASVDFLTLIVLPFQKDVKNTLSFHLNINSTGSFVFQMILHLLPEYLQIFKSLCFHIYKN